MSKSLDKSVNEALAKYFDNDINKVNIILLKQYVTEKKITKKIAKELYHLVSKQTFNVKELNPYKNTKLDKYGKQKVIDLIKEIKNNPNFEDILKKFSPEDIEENIIYEDGTKEDLSSKGFYYERLWDLCIKFGVTGLTKGTEIVKDKKGIDKRVKGKLLTSHIITENPNSEEYIGFPKSGNCWSSGKLDILLNSPIRSSNSGGYSDITFFNKHIKDGQEMEDLYFVSVKYYKKEKDVASYDIGKLCTLINKHQKNKRSIKILLFVNNKQKCMMKWGGVVDGKRYSGQNKSSDILMQYIDPLSNETYSNVYDSADLRVYYNRLRILLSHYDYFETVDDIRRFEKDYLEVLKNPFIPRFHQRLFIDKINNLIIDGKSNILVGAIPRSGKSYIMGGTILDHINRSRDNRPMNFLLITPAPTETFGEYRKLFGDHLDFDTIEAVYLDEEGKKNINIDTQIKHRVYIVSKQLLGWGKTPNETGNPELQITGEGIEKQKRQHKNITKYLGETMFNIIFLDEAHFGLSTDSAQLILQELNQISKNAKKTPKVFVTATYNKPSRVYDIEPECKLTWDINDIKIMKELTFENYTNNDIRKQFGHSIYDKAIESEGGEEGIKSLSEQYKKFPEPYLITSVWDKDFLKDENDKILMSGYGFDMNELFKNDGNSFIAEYNVIEMMKYYFGYPDKEQSYDNQAFYRNRGILPRIRRICSNECRTMQTSDKYKTSQLWFLPYGPGNKVAGVVVSLLNLLNGGGIFKDIKDSYHFFIAVEIKGKKGKTSGNVTYMDKPSTIKNDIESISEKADNIIILAGARLQLGISFEGVDIVTLWNNVSSTDANFQMLFRSMTEKKDYLECNPNEYCNNKKYGFMVDLNPQRVLTTMTLFETNSSKANKKDVDIVDIRNVELSKMINVDKDVMLDKYGEDDSKRGEFVKELFNKLYSSWNTLSSNIQKTAKNFSYDMDLLKSIEKQLRNIKLPRSPPAPPNVNGSDPDKFQKPEGKPPKKKTEKEEKEEKKVKEIPLDVLASEAVADIITLMNIYTIYLSEKADCILLENRSIPEVTNNIDELQEVIFGDSELKDSFLDVLNTRLGGYGDHDSLIKIIDILKKSINEGVDKISMNRIIMGQKKQIYTIREPDKLLEYINQNLTPKVKEKKKAGEVFTPISMVKEMLDKLPKDVWHDPTLTWLDPAAGIGNFPIIVYLELMKGLKSPHIKVKYPEKMKGINLSSNESIRKHILENMLFMSELNSKNVNILNKIFCVKTGTSGYDLNIHKGDTLKLDIKSKWDKRLKENGYMFDIIMGNPPYNAGDTKTTGEKNIYVRFITYSFKYLQPSGYLLFIHPPSYRIDNHYVKGTKFNLNELYTSKKIICIRMYSVSEVQRLFNVMINVDYIVLQNKDNTNKDKTEVIDVHNEVSNIIIKKGDFIPNFGFTLLNELSKLVRKYGHIEVENSSEHHNNIIKKHKGKYKNIHLIIEKGKRIYLSNDEHSKHRISKMFINALGVHYVYYDKGSYGATEQQLLILKPSKIIREFISSELFQYIALATKITGNNISRNDIYKYLPNFDNARDIKDMNDIYKLLKVNDKYKSAIIRDYPLKTFKDIDIIENYKSNSSQEKNKKVIHVKQKTNKKPNSPKKQAKKTMKKSKCSDLHPEPPCKEDKPRLKNGCCYKDKKTKKGGGKRRRHKRSKRKRR